MLSLAPISMIGFLSAAGNLDIGSEDENSDNEKNRTFDSHDFAPFGHCEPPAVWSGRHSNGCPDISEIKARARSFMRPGRIQECLKNGYGSSVQAMLPRD
jgi:hypothetical protein